MTVMAATVKHDFLSRLPPRLLMPIIRIGVSDYVNTAGTRRELVRLTAPAGQAIVITRIRTRYFTTPASEQLTLISEPYLIAFQGGSLRAGFEVSVDRGAVGDFQFRVRDVGAGAEVGGGGLYVDIAVPDLLAWNAGYWAAYVRSGGTFLVEHRVVSAIGGAGTVPDLMGAEVGGFQLPERALNEVIEVR